MLVKSSNLTKFNRVYHTNKIRNVPIRIFIIELALQRTRLITLSLAMGKDPTLARLSNAPCMHTVHAVLQEKSSRQAMQHPADPLMPVNTTGPYGLRAVSEIRILCVACCGPMQFPDSCSCVRRGKGEIHFFFNTIRIARKLLHFCLVEPHIHRLKNPCFLFFLISHLVRSPFALRGSAVSS